VSPAQRLAAEHARAVAEAAAAAHAEALRAREAELGPEPTPDCGEPTAMCAVRMPDGTRAARRFRLSDPVSLLFEFVDAKGAGGVQGGYQLVTQFPRRVISRPEVEGQEQQGVLGAEQHAAAGHGSGAGPMETEPAAGMGVGHATSSSATSHSQYRAAGASLGEHGLGQGGQEVLMLEPLEPLE
jgi:hypothetical protein